ncbi:MAG: zf-HC2 domain-containing protein [Chloroflexi bacterium]|nr:MAG: zf-HC2 domain-containing protein [Chloroflexota bacterium]
MRYQHVTHLITRYIHGQLRPAQRARVVNHVRTCAACRSALAREEWIASDLRRELPSVGAGGTRGGQLAQVWAGVWQDVSGPRARARVAAWMPGLAALIAMVLLVSIALPLLTESGDRAEAAPHQPRPISTASPTPAASETHEADHVSPAVNLPRATVAYAGGVGATPAPMPEATVSPEARMGSLQ